MSPYISVRPARFLSQVCGSLLACAALLLSSTAVQAQSKPDPKAAPQIFVGQVADQLIEVVKKDRAAGPLNLPRINAIVEQYVLPYVNFEKTTRLAAGKHWRQATPEQQKALADAFRNTLIRTYSGALTRVDAGTNMQVQPFRGDANADDVVVQTHVVESTNAQPIRIDYRLEKTPAGWKIYDLNVEDIWLIQNYRNQFSQEITRSGIDGLIAALNKRNSSN